MKRIMIAAAAAAIAAGVTACGSSTPKPSVEACTKAYPAWFLASAAAGKTTPTPLACKGLTSAQLDQIAAKYLEQLAN